MVKEVIMVLLCLCAISGFSWLMIEKFRLQPAMAPLASMCCIIVIVYAASLLGVLLPMTILLICTGVMLAVWMICSRSKALLHADLLIFAVGWAALALRYQNSLLVAYDDFSHWGMIVRHLFSHDMLPGPQDSLITFQSYPTGAASWIYFMCRFGSQSDGMLLAAQAGLTLAGWLALFALAGRCGGIVKRIALSAVMIVGLSLFQGTASLMVDNLVAAIAVGCLAMVTDCRRWLKKHLWIVGMCLAALSILKDSGLFFVAVLLLFNLYLHRNKAGFFETLKLCVPLAAVRLSWFVHVKAAFPAADISRHALTVENMRKMGADKSIKDIFDIGKDVLAQAFSFQNQAIQLLLVILLMVALLIVLNLMTGKPVKAVHRCAVLLGASAVYFGWLISLWMMYTFSMELFNAQNLVAFERYNSTCALFIYGILAVWMLEESILNPNYIIATVLAICLPLSTGAWNAGIPRLFQENYNVPIRHHMEHLQQKRPLQTDEHAIIVIDSAESASFAGYMARYVFQSTDIDILTETEIKEFPSADVYYLLAGTSEMIPDGSAVITFDGAL